ncbi:Methyl-accepting chemotaxis protein [Halomicrobium zhouii]|uniref:Methyl-accepting chemotaxis protein n=1 Tax=Halomicrobium zhouii TaxID=767519 RepID=A0A1I6LT97_9EURY|nr:methyl-accepting chemotaxis protein [Halomicrobium zhouii]SFS06691.1 Methyl-accepting chemotaxis protein [Halomicrobium zhouii]
MSGDDSAAGSSGGIAQTVTPNFIRQSFALKFGLVLLVMGMSVGVIGLVATEQVKSETQTNVENEYRNGALQEADIIEQWVSRNRLSTKLMSSDEGWDSNEDLSLKLENEKSELSGEVVGMHIVDTSGEQAEVVASNTLREGPTLSGRPQSWILEESFSSASDVAMSETYLTNRQHVVGFVSPVPSGEGRYILIEYSIEDIAGSLQGADRATGGFTQVVNEEGTVMIDEPRQGESGVGNVTLYSYSGGEADRPLQEAIELRSSSDDAGVIQEMQANDNVIDERYTVGYSPVSGTDWVVLVHAPYSSVFGFVQDVQQWGLIATGGGVVLIGGVGAILGYSTSSTIDRLTRKTEEMREGNLDVEISSSRIDNIGRLYDGFADMRDSLKNQIDEAERARKEAEVSRAEAMEVNNYLQQKADEFSQAMEATAAGDMTQRMETEGENESMDRIANEFNSMIEELEKTTGQLKSFADEVAESGDVVLASSESVRDASEQVAESIQKISDDAYEQKDRLQGVSENLDELVDTLERFQAENPSVDMGDSIDQFRQVATTMQEAAETSERMMAESENVAGAAEEQAAELNEVSSRAEKLKRYARPLGDILNRFETEAEHEFVFSGGPSQATRDDGDD